MYHQSQLQASDVSLIDHFDWGETWNELGKESNLRSLLLIYVLFFLVRKSRLIEMVMIIATTSVK